MPENRYELAKALADRYRLERELGAGGMATVYLAEDLRHRRKVALKVLRPDLSAVLGAERFSKEIELTANLQHANILPLFDSGEAAGQLFYVMPYVDGETLRARMARGAVPPDEALAILRDVARALGYAHRRGVLHRDIKPENILLAGGAAVVADFGIAKALSASRTVSDGANATLTSLGTSLGTPAYMAPEQAAGDPAIDQRADVYAWGLIAYELLAGRHLFAEQTTPQALMAAHISAAPRALGEVQRTVPAALAALVMQCLAKAPDERPKDGEELAARLGAINVSGETVVATKGRSSRALVMGGVVVAVLVAAAAGVAMFRSKAAPPEGPRSIAVLPFEIGSDTANAYIADGLSAELTTKLSKIPGLNVRAYSSAGAIRSTSPKEAAGLLGVQAVVTANVRRAAARLHVNASLVNGVDARVLWSESFDGEDADQFALQERLAESIAGALRITLTAETRSAVTAGRTSDPVAHDLVQRARYLIDRLGDSVSIREAIRLSEDAVKRDSTYADAWSVLAGAWMTMGDDVLPGAEVERPARKALDRALKLAPDDPLALGWAGAMYSWYLRDIPETHRVLQKALARDSTHFIALPNYGVTLLVTDTDSAAKTVARALRHNPFSTVALQYLLWIPEVFRVLPADSGALACSRIRSFAPPLSVQCEALRLGALGRAQDARSTLHEIDKMRLKPNELAYLAMTATRLGDTTLARNALGRVEELAKHRYVREDAVAMAYFDLGDKESSLRWWLAGGSSHVAGMILAQSEKFAPLRSDARFRAELVPLPWK